MVSLKKSISLSNCSMSISNIAKTNQTIQNIQTQKLIFLKRVKNHTLNTIIIREIRNINEYTKNTTTKLMLKNFRTQKLIKKSKYFLANANSISNICNQHIETYYIHKQDLYSQNFNA